MLSIGFGCDRAPTPQRAQPAPSEPEPAAESTSVDAGPHDSAPEVPPPSSTEDGRLVEFEAATDEQTQLLTASKKALAEGDQDAARRALEQLVADGPVSAQRASGVIALADLYCRSGTPKKGVALLARFQRQVPPLAELFYVEGGCHRNAGQPEAAIFAYTNALRLQPLLLRSHIEIGGMYGELGEAELSGKAFLAYEIAVYRYASILEDPDAHPTDKKKICEAFSYLPDDRAAQSLLRAIRDANPEVRLAAVDALGEVGSKAMLPSLTELQSSVAKTDPRLAHALGNATSKIEASPDDGDDRVAPTFGPADAGPTDSGGGNEPQGAPR